MTRPTARRIESLDGLRGLAALVVVFTHSVGALARPPLVGVAMHHSPAALLLGGDGAIHLFFVLSGYVLSGSALRGSGIHHLVQFYVRRLFRIHPPYLAAILIAWLASSAYGALGNEEHLSGWIRDVRSVRLSGEQLFRSALFPGDAFGLMPVGWTLKIEMIFSFLLPGMLWIAHRSHWLVLIFAGGVALGLGSGPHPVHWYTLDFAVGIALYTQREPLQGLALRLPRFSFAAISLLGLALIAYPEYSYLRFRAPQVSSLLYVTGAVLLVLCGVHSRLLREWLAREPLRTLGRISYSVYLLHMTVILVCLPWAGEGIRFAAAMRFTLPIVALSCLVATASFYLIERQAIRIGNRACRWLAGATHSDAETSRIVDDPLAEAPTQRR